MRDRASASVLIVLALAGVAATAFALWRGYELEFPKALWSLLLLPLIAALYLWRIRRRGGEVKLPTLSVLSKGPVDLLARLRHLPFATGLLGLGILLAALARPQSKDKWQDVTKEGIDIIIAMDFSASMLAKDFKPDRLTAARNVAMRFIDDRPDDRIGLVVYEGEAFTQCPLTTDHKVLQNLFLQAKSGLITGGTAVGTGLATAINRLRDSDGKSKVVILLTDGVNNAGTIQPIDAAQ
ncbi:MAG: VWA domain-containing protein, partial [Flavobacteriales bacterium]|nr:VWA domain-containing protein [Flavobacteriales bacterium]